MQHGEIHTFEYKEMGEIVEATANADVGMWQFSVARNGPLLRTDIHGCIAIETYNARSRIGSMLHLPPSGRGGPGATRQTLTEVKAYCSYVLDAFFQKCEITRNSRVAMVAGCTNSLDDEGKQKEPYCKNEEYIAALDDADHLELLQHVLGSIMARGLRTELFLDNKEKSVYLATQSGLLRVTGEEGRRRTEVPRFMYDMKHQRTPLTKTDYLLQKKHEQS